MTNNEPKPVGELIAEYRENQTAFERQLWKRWQPAFDLYDWVLLQAQNVAIFMFRHHRQEAVEQQDALFEAQTRLQARAYRTACEVRALLVSGNPDGALARWRSIHEILVVMKFLHKYGPETADRYLKYDVVQTAENWDRYEQLPADWQILPVTREEGFQVKEEQAEIAGKYGPALENENGWACAALGLTKDKSRVTFARLEEEAGLRHFHFYYHIASNHIHVNMKGLANDVRSDLVPTMWGFSASAGTTLWELAECTLIMAKLRPTSDTEILERALIQAVTDANQMFRKIQQQIEEEVQNTTVADS